ncbi:MAG: TolC family protein, partial [Muribaculaceae bacterium]|nr:TolC family protein [Muribaculaceae bacterium]
SVVLPAIMSLFLSNSALAQNNVTVAAADTLLLSLDECIEIALDKSPTVKVADMEIKRVDYSKKEVIGQLFPDISFAANYSRTLAKQTMYMNFDGFGAMGGGGDLPGGEGEEDAATRASSNNKNNGIKVGLDNSYQVGFSASMPLIAPQLWKSISLSNAQIMQNVESARSSRLSLINKVQNAYYTLLLAKDSYLVVKQNYENAVFTATTVEGKYKEGAASEYELLRAKVQVKNVEPELLQSEIAIKQATLQLKVLMGIDVEVPVAVKSQLSDYQKTMYEDVLNIDRNLSGNSDLRALDLQTEYLKKAVAVQKLSFSPTLALTANYHWTTMNNGNPFKNLQWNPYSSVGLALSIPIFQGGQRVHKIKQAQVAVNEMSYQRDNLERSLRMQVELQIDNITKHVKQIDTNAAGMQEAEKAHSIMQMSYKIGAASFLDLRDAELALTAARLAYYQAIYNYLVANSDLQLLLGNADINKYQPSYKN